MAKVELRALKTFYNAGRFTIAGDSFKVEEYQANAYITRGLAEYMTEPTPNLEEATAGEKTYEEMTVSELRVIAKDKGVTGYYAMTKAELIEAIRQAEASPTEPTADETATPATEGEEA